MLPELITEPLEFAFMRNALWAVILASLNCAVVGVYVVLRRMAFMGGALSHTILPGMVFAYLRGIHLFWGALVAAIITALGVGWLSSRRRMREDTAIGVMLSAMFAIGVVMMSRVRSFRDFGDLLFGSILAVTPQDLYLTGGVSLIVLIVLALFHKELELSSYDPEYSRVIGARPNRLRHVLLLLVALSVVSAVQIVGALLATALLITPAAAATLLARNLPGAMLISILIAIGSGIMGLYISYYQNIASGAAIVLCASTCFILAWIYRSLKK